MNKSYILITFSIVLAFSVLSCRKDSPLNVTLYDKPLPTIQHYIQGKWKLVYGKGGICSTCVFPCDNCSVEFTSNNKFISKSFVITTDTTSIHWIRDIGIYLNGDSTYIMTFNDKFGVPWSYVIDRIYFDTLIYHDNADDPMFYYNIKLR